MAPSSTKVYLTLALIASAAFAKSPISFVDGIERREAVVRSIDSFNDEGAKTPAANSNASANDKDEYRLPRDIKPTHYDLDLTVDLEKKFNFDGTVTIQITPTSNASQVQLHAYKEMKLKHVAIFEAGEKEPLKNIKTTFNNETDILTIGLDKNVVLVAKKNYVLSISFESPLLDDGAGFYKDSYLTKDANRSWYAVTHFEPVGARRAFPCFDEPFFKATFVINITHDQKYHAISNTPAESTDTVEIGGKKKTKTSFKQTPTMSTYLVAYAVTDFEKKSNDKENMTAWVRKDVVNMTQFAVDTGVKVLKALEEYTGVPYELTKMDQIGLPLLSPGAMENWGLVTYRESYLLYDEKINATSSLQKIASIIAHEFAHQWFGNLVSPDWWKYLWLNEGFATYFEYYITDKVYPEFRIWDQLVVTTLQGRAFGIDVTEKTRPMDYAYSSKQKDVKSLFDNIAYHKAGSVIRMFSHVLGEENFKLALNRYLTNRKHSTSTSKELFDAFQKIVEEKKLQLPVNSMHELAKSWVEEVGFPVVTVTRNKEMKKVKVQQSRFFLDSVPANASKPKWWVPLSYTTQKEANFENTAPKAWLNPANESVEIDENAEDGWVLFNIQETGYYRVQYDEENWKDIAKFLKEGNISIIHPLNRAQLIDDALNLARAGLTNYTVALDVVAYLNRETDYIPMLAAFNGFTFLKKVLVTTDAYENFQEFVTRIAESLLTKVKLEESAEDEYVTKLNRIQAMKWACDFGSKLCREHAVGKLKEWLKAPFSSNGFSANLKKVTLCGALRAASYEVWTNVLNAYTLNKDANEKDVILSALGCSLQPDILENFLNLASQPDSIFARPRAVFQAVYTSSSVGVKVALDFIVRNAEVIKSHDKAAVDNLVFYVNDLASMLVRMEDVHKLETFVEKHNLPNDRVKDALQTARRNIEWYKKNGKTIANWMESAHNATLTESSTSNDKGSATSVKIASILFVLPVLVMRIY